MEAVAANDESNVVRIRRNTLEWILFGALGFLTLVVVGFVGTELREHDSRLNVLEQQAARTVVLCETIQSSLTVMNARLERIENLMLEDRGTVPDENGG